MRIAFVSYEYPPETGGGGIGTYLVQVAAMLADRGHEVEIFAGGSAEPRTTSPGRGIVLNRTGETVEEFVARYPRLFIGRHSTDPFDVVEIPEYQVQGKPVLEFPGRPPVVTKLHTPASLVARLNYVPPSRLMRCRWTLGAWRRFKRPAPLPDPLKYDHTHDPERTVGLRAEVIASPSAALREIVAKEWKVPESSILHLPYPYRPSQVLLDVPADTSTSRVTYIGRLEGRKGVVELAEAIPRVIRTFPGTTFRFIGRSLPSPTPGLGMRDYLVRRLRRFRDAVEFVDQVEITDIPHYLRDTDICVFPSRWENFPNVCLEAMSSARGVVGSREGGMREMLDDGHYGEVVDPRSPEDIARGLSALLGDRQRRIALGEAARERVLAEYGGDALGARYEACYRSAVAKRHEAIPCPV